MSLHRGPASSIHSIPRSQVLEELEKLDQHIADCGQRIEEQKERVKSIRGTGRNSEDSEYLLGNLVSSLGALYQLREIVVQELEDADR